MSTAFVATFVRRGAETEFFLQNSVSQSRFARSLDISAEFLNFHYSRNRALIQSKKDFPPIAFELGLTKLQPNGYNANLTKRTYKKSVSV